MAILIEFRASQEEPWEFEGIYGHPGDKISFVPVPGVTTFDEFTARIDGPGERVAIWAKQSGRALRLVVLEAGGRWSCAAVNDSHPQGKFYLRITDLDVTHLPLFECPLCHQMTRPFEINAHGEGHNQAELAEQGLLHEEFWGRLYMAFADYLADGGFEASIQLGLCELAGRIHQRIGQARLYDVSRTN